MAMSHNSTAETFLSSHELVPLERCHGRAGYLVKVAAP